ncbi:MAG TPA: BON domain-containing protein [Pyrinomonadaceae bacterium]|jgi:hyperosmotically inducible protein
MNKIKTGLIAIVAVLLIAASSAFAAPAKTDERVLGHEQIVEKIRKELVTLPWYGVFDNLAYKVEGGTVTLYGQVVRPTTRSDAGARVARIPGIERVVNQIEVLPLSPFDDEIRLRTYRSIFNTGSLYRYALGANPSIHIVVKRGHVTLEGVVANKMDSQLAYMAARTVPGSFSVTNNLRTEDSKGELY